jgi:hypothetical protein
VVRVDLGAHQQGVVPPPLVREWKVQIGVVRLAGIEALNVPDDTNHHAGRRWHLLSGEMHARPRPASDVETLANRVLPGPEAPGGGRADDRHREERLGLGVGERAAPNETDAERVE